MRDAVIKYIINNNINIDGKDFYQFGVFVGVSLKVYINKFLENNINPRKIFGFDSWKGLPAEDKNVERFKYHIEGGWNTQNELGKKSIEDAKNTVLNSLPEHNFAIEFIDGFFNESLIDEIVPRLKPASIVDIDVDLYISTIDLLEFMFKNKLIIEGTILYYDDWGSTEEFKGGESLAHKKMCEKYNVICEQFYSSGNIRPHIQKGFIVKSVGERNE